MTRLLAAAALVTFSILGGNAASAAPCSGVVNVCPDAEGCSGTVSVCPGADPDQCASTVDVCGIGVTLCLPCILP